MGIRITRTLLDSYRKTKKEIPALQMELEMMQQEDNGIGSSVIMDYRKGYPQPQGITGFDQKRYDNRKRVLDDKIARCKAVEEWIEAIEDGQTRYVFKTYYLEGMTWEKIASKTGYSRQPDYPRLMIRDKYLREKGIK